MINQERIELFILKCAAINAELKKIMPPIVSPNLLTGESDIDLYLKAYVRQFDIEIRHKATKMAAYYQLFHMIENDIRRLISETMESAHGLTWWDSCVPQLIKEEVLRNRKRELDAGVALRSEYDLDYTTFGQLGDIIRANWTDFAGMLSNQSALGRVLHSLNMSRGTIAHCGILADDEVDRLKLNVKDWFRVLAGPAQ